MSFPFNVRVYGVLILNGKVLLSHEKALGKEFTKFPGGGLEYGEGPEDCVKREFLEETGESIQIESHFYTTGFFQQSAFDPAHQVISIYYRVAFAKKQRAEKIKAIEGGQQFEWKKLNDLDQTDVTFEIDKHIVRLLKAQNSDSAKS
jgi:ADP-ribose pyrophosphatase YjhB (NUDIX family)